MNIRIFEVGGSIRNELLGRPVKDRDFAVLAEGGYASMRCYLLEQGCTFYQERPQFVSIKAKHPELGAVDFTLARKESFYTDARHPDTVKPAASIHEDLARRDFTMNAIAREVGTTELIDPHGGLDAIRDRMIRCVRDPIERFKEDRLRMFRAIRFACQLDFHVANNVFEAMEYFLSSDFESVSAEMVQTELDKAFRADTWKAMELITKLPEIQKVMQLKGVWLRATLGQK